ncbi:MAG TPA: hypothetical protein VD969_01030 [Symbiobacteriaceae bacterium]|nr:hypothetical protein [Symbiobacteriaceae bacterium]
MHKVLRALLVIVLSSFVLVAIAGPAVAAPPSVSPMASWNNCGTGGCMN